MRAHAERELVVSKQKETMHRRICEVLLLATHIRTGILVQGASDPAKRDAAELRAKLAQLEQDDLIFLLASPTNSVIRFRLAGEDEILTIEIPSP